MPAWWLKIAGSLGPRNVPQDALSQKAHSVSWYNKHKPIPVFAPSGLLSSKVRAAYYWVGLDLKLASQIQTA